jgi:hypothetical protein
LKDGKRKSGWNKAIRQIKKIRMEKKRMNEEKVEKIINKLIL